MNDRLDLIPVRPSTPGSPATGRTWTCPSSAQLTALSETTPRRTATWSPASTWTRRRAGASPTGPSSKRCWTRPAKPEAPFQEILVWKFSRFTRKREHAVAFKSMLRRRRGIRVVSITEQADDTPTGKLLEAIIESVDEFYSENLAQEVVAGHEGSRFPRLLGRQLGFPYGFSKLYGAGRSRRSGPQARTRSGHVDARGGAASSAWPLQGRGILDITKHPQRTRASPTPPAGSGPRTPSTSSCSTRPTRERWSGASTAKDKRAARARGEGVHPAIVSKRPVPQGEPEAAGVPRSQAESTPGAGPAPTCSAGCSGARPACNRP